MQSVQVSVLPSPGKIGSTRKHFSNRRELSLVTFHIPIWVCACCSKGGQNPCLGTQLGYVSKGFGRNYATEGPKRVACILTHTKLLYCSLNCPIGKSASAQGVTQLGQSGEAGWTCWGLCSHLSPPHPPGRDPAGPGRKGAGVRLQSTRQSTKVGTFPLFSENISKLSTIVFTRFYRILEFFLPTTNISIFVSVQMHLRIFGICFSPSGMFFRQEQ